MKALGFSSSCGHLPNSAISNKHDENEENPHPKKHVPTIRTGFAVYPFIPQEATTGSSTKSSEPGGYCANRFRRNFCNNSPGSVT
jgi:hypothetical protein